MRMPRTICSKASSGMESQMEFKWTNHRNQYIACCAGCLVCLSQGCMLGWIAPATMKLASKETPLSSGPLTTEQISWIGSTGAVGIFFGSILFGFVTSLFGCKRATLYMAIPAITFWIIIYFGKVYVDILIACFAIGMISGGFQPTITLYISEIANNDIRGRLGTLNSLFQNIGILFGYILGTFVDYQFIPCISIMVPVGFAILFSVLPNTPQYYFDKGQINKAEQSLKFYKGYEGINELEEIAILREFVRLAANANKINFERRLRMVDLCDCNAIKGIGSCIALVIFAQLTANFAITNYTVLIFQKAGAPLDPFISSIILGIISIPGSLLTSYLADILGRRLLSFLSLIGSAIGLFTIAIYQYLKLNGYDLSAYDCIPVVCLSFVSLISAGICALSIICSVENLPSKIRAFGMVIVGISLSLTAFASLKIFPFLMETLELYGCMIIYGIGCVVGAIFVICVLKETRGQSLDDDDDNSRDSNVNNNGKECASGEGQRPLNSSKTIALRYHTFSDC